ncbi:MAG: SRPBCC domain-containing protein [Blastocatellia bacterium]
MSKPAPNTRRHQHEIEINAPPDVVWKAITEADEITRWFAEEARVSPGEGGSCWVSWGEGQEGTSRIEVWEPGKRFRLINLPAEGDPGPADGTTSVQQAPIVVDYTLESRGDRTVLRLVHSNIPNSPEWDGFYDGTNYGWDMFFRGLRHYIEKHWGKQRSNIMVMQPIQVTRQEGWEKLTGAEGLAASGSLANLNEGQRYSVTTAWGEHLEGEVLISKPGRIIVMTIEPLDNALLSASVEEMNGQTFFYLTLSGFGWEKEKVEASRNQWTTSLKGLYSMD